MYLDYFGFNKKPFLISPDPGFLYPSRVHQESFAHLRYGLQREGGFLLLTGEVGTGKTTLCRLLIDELPQHFRLAYILNAQLDSQGLLRSIIKELHIDAADKDSDINSCMELLYEKLLQEHAGNHQILVIIEEAQNLSPEVLETLRLLTNLETNTKKLLHILLIGQPELLDTLARPQLRQLNQRVVSRCHLTALSRKDVGSYLKHRLKIAGKEEAIFTKAAINTIYRYTGGIPRLINLLAEHALMGAYAENKKIVSCFIVKKAAREVFGHEIQLNRSKFSLMKLEYVAVLGVALTFVLLAGNLTIPGNALKPIAGFIQSNISGAGNESGAIQANNEKTADLIPILQSDNDLAVLDQTPVQKQEGVFTQWLHGQGLAIQSDNLFDACRLAEDYKFRCDHFDDIELDFLKGSEKRAIVALHNNQEGKDFYLINEWAVEELVLANGSGTKRLSVSAFEQLWDKSVVVLWQPPGGFKKPLFPGEKNLQLVDYIQARLTNKGLLSEEIITGGVYSDYLVSIVKNFQQRHNLKVDGIVGAATLLRLGMIEPIHLTSQHSVD